MTASEMWCRADGPANRVAFGVMWMVRAERGGEYADLFLEKKLVGPSVPR